MHWGDGNSDTYATQRREDPHLRRRPRDPRDHGRPGRRGRHVPRPRERARRCTVNNVAPSIAISGAASVNEGSPYSLTLGAVTDPGTDTVTSYVVHWGDGNSDTYATDGVQDAHLRRRPEHPRDHGRPGRRGRHLPRPRERAVGHGQQRRAVDRDQRRGERQRGLALQPDPGRGHRSGRRHGHELHRPLGRRQQRHLQHRTAPRRTPTPTARTPTTITVDLADEDGTFLDRANALSVTVNNVAPTIAISGAAERQRGLALQPDPGRGHRSGHRHGHELRRPLGRRQQRHLHHRRRQDAHLRRRPEHHADHGRPGRRGRHLPRPPTRSA